ncbi:hypothetical protein [Streptomyces sp. ERV7]|uniref:hypothetical protein n=1 Tax=Streptomyces sp. ERV7 TaxID=1322334 RepID=UPI003B63F4EC
MVPTPRAEALRDEAAGVVRQLEALRAGPTPGAGRLAAGATTAPSATVQRAVAKEVEQPVTDPTGPGPHTSPLSVAQRDAGATSDAELVRRERE